MPRGFSPSRKDISQPAIEAAFIRAGWCVEDVHQVPNGFDLFVAKHLLTIAIECKSGKKRMTREQAEKANNWQGYHLSGSDPLVLLEQAEAILGVWER